MLRVLMPLMDALVGAVAEFDELVVVVVEA
jgi:hypothetical protein